MFFVALPLRCSISMIMVLVVPGVYAATTLPLPVGELEENLRRRLLLSIILLVIGILGLIGRAEKETGQRIEFLRLRLTKADWTKEKVLRFEAEHEVIKGPFSRIAISNPALPAQDEEQSAVTQGTCSLATTAIIFGRSHNDEMLSLQLQSMTLIAEREHWLLSADHLECYDPGSSGLLGQGSFGLVYRGEYLGVPVAVKVPKLADCRGIGALANELRVFRRLRHPYIVAFYGALIANNADLVLVEELVDGPSLWNFVLKSSSPLTAETKRKVLLCICNALVYLHGQVPTVVHGDLGPSNVIVQKLTWQPKLIDFGLSRIRGQAAPMGGTPQWAAPEVVLGGAMPDPSADVFSFGRLAYFVVTGQVPLEGLGPGDILRLAQQGSVPDLCWADTSSTMALVPLKHECQVLCRQSLVFNRTLRAKSVELAEELEAWPEPGHVRTGPEEITIPILRTLAELRRRRAPPV
ncbi:unnamed protein product [Polarella glacialis]|uniref:Protein kinase domain-containing protein n=1 Tax=Polarella glacialis TaxID=89957 RepID=A0A813FUC3_POLGL|nr:unnamed protein product [Polarella glacialis]